MLLEILAIIGFSTWKFLPMPFLAVNGFGFGIGHSILFTILGGWVGTLFFYGSSNKWFEKARKRALEKEKRAREKGEAFFKKKFTRTNKIIVRVKRAFGLIGLALLTPTIISIPLGSIIAAKYFRRNRWTVPALLISVAFWSVLLSTIADSARFIYN